MLTAESVVLSERDFRKISSMVYEHCGIKLCDDKKELVRARLTKRLRLSNFNSFAQYMKHVLKDKTGKEFSLLIDAISTNLTSFFREPQHFEFVRDKFLPLLLEQKQKERNFKIRAWSAGCSSGEEPYSLAITLLDSVEGGGRWDIKVLATDISTSILETAKAGIYDNQRIQPVSSMQRQKYLTLRSVNDQTMFEVNWALKNVVIFKYLNLIKDWPVTVPLDFIFCRNVMIYFDKATQTQLVNRFWNQLNPGGILFTGHSESLAGIEHKFNYIQPTIYIKP